MKKKVSLPFDVMEASGLLPSLCKIAFEIIRKEFEDSHNKRVITTSKKKDGSAFTYIDLKAQKAIIKQIKKTFPYAGILAEENVNLPCTDPNGEDYTFIIDAMDGSSQLEWNSITNIGVITSLMYQGKIVASAVGELATQQIFTLLYKKRSPRLIATKPNLAKFKKAIKQNSTTMLREHKVRLKRHPMNYYSSLVSEMCMPKRLGGVYYEIGVIGGAICVAFIDLWLSTYGGLILPGNSEGLTPWDFWGNYHISKSLGYKFFLLNPNWGNLSFDETFVEFNPKPTLDRIKQDWVLYIVHNSKVPELKEWFKFIKLTREPYN